MIETQIRPALARDAAGVAEIYNQIIRDTTITFASVEKSNPELVAAFEEADAYLVAEKGGRIVGFASFAAFRKGPGYAGVKEHSICLHTSMRGTGLGTILLHTLENAARAQGVIHMVAGVSGENDAGLRFHAAQGYKNVGHLPDIGQKFGRSIDLVLMQKKL
jgi:phosphinothricin acetyltransferase